MKPKQKSIGIAFSEEKWEAIDARVKALKLGERSRSKYFNMLWELDCIAQFKPYYHEGDGKLHFFPESAVGHPLKLVASPTERLQLAAEAPQATYGPAADAAQRDVLEAPHRSESEKPNPEAHK